MKISQKGLDLIKRFEGLRNESYRCPAGVWTIGYGHTGDVQPGAIITEEGAEALLRKDVERFEEGVTHIVGPCKQQQFDALVCFSFNVGLGALKTSTLLKKHKQGDFAGAANEFLKWNRAGGSILPGLTRRRAQERGLYLS